MTWNFWLSNIIQIWDSVLLLQGQCLSVIDCGKYTANSYVVIWNMTNLHVSAQIQPWKKRYKPLWYKHYGNEVTLRRQKPPAASHLIFGVLFKRFRSFNAKNLGSAGQRAAKLPAIKLWEWFDGAGVRTRAHWLTGARAGWQTFLETSNFDS